MSIIIKGNILILKSIESLFPLHFFLGKTLALLSASCAWLKEYKNLRAESKANCRLHSNIIPEKIATVDNRTVTANNKAVNGSGFVFY